MTNITASGEVTRFTNKKTRNLNAPCKKINIKTITMANENNWGGWREGSGRKQGDRQECLYIRISAEAMAKLDSLTTRRNRGQFINDLILSL